MTGDALPHSLELVPATPDDREWLDELRRAAYRDLFLDTWGAWDEARHLRHFAACWEKGGIDVVEADGLRVGMIQILESEGAVEIGEIQVLPSHQGRGIGTRLLRETLDDAHRRGKKVSLAAGLRNVRAVKLYERLGFRHVCRNDTHFFLVAAPRG